MGRQLCLAAYWVVVDIVEPSDTLMMIVVGVADGGLLLSALIRRIRYRMRVRQQVQALRTLGDASRSALLAGLRGEPIAMLLDREVSWHGRPEVDGLIERFRFSPLDQRETRVMTFASWGAAGIAAVPIATTLLPLWGKVGLAAVAAALGVTGARLTARSRDMNRWFEVSPFGFSEVRGDGRVRRVLWDMPLRLHNNHAANRIELSVPGAPGQIDIPYGVVQLERLVQLIIEKGGLVAERPGGESAT